LTFPGRGENRAPAGIPGTVSRAVLLACFFFSGATGLVYEVLWTRVLCLAFGHTVWAASAVLAVFMGGIALGSRLLGPLADRVADPLRLYAMLELTLGAYCLAVPGLLELARRSYLAWGPAAGEGVALRLALQTVLAATVLLLPSTLMGGTLPALSRALIPARGDLAPGFSLLYGINTLGAMTGAFAAGYLLLPSLGIRTVNLAAAAVNIAIGGGLLLGGRPPAPFPVPAPETTAPATAFRVPQMTASLFLWSFAATGAAAMTAQVAWVRSLILVIGSSTYAFSAVLVTVLAGLALGSLLYRKLRLRTPAQLAALMAATALSLAALLPAFALLPRFFLALLPAQPVSYLRVQLIQFLVTAAAVMAPSLLMGLCFPLLAGLAAGRRETVGGTVGAFYAANTAGAIAGSLAAGFALVPLLGAQGTLAAAAAIYLAIAAAFLAVIRPAWGRIPLLAALGMGALLLLSPGWDRWLMAENAAVYPGGYLRRMEDPARPRIIFFREGISSTVAVMENEGNRWLTVNGKTDAGTASDRETQGKLAFLPLLLNPDARRVGIIGLGSGMTAGVAGLFPRVESIEVYEIEPAVAEAARLFGSINQGILDDPRLALHIEDGRSALESSGPPFDVIISEPSNPWIAGISSLFTLEAIEAARARLAPRGVFCLWLHTYSISPSSYRMVVRTFQRVFPDATLWQSLNMGDTFLMGIREGGAACDIAGLKQRLAGLPGLAGGFAWSPLRPIDLFLTSFLLGPDDLRRFAGSGPLNTDDLDFLGFEAPRAMYGDGRPSLLSSLLAFRAGDHPPFLVDPLLEGPRAILFRGECHMKMGENSLALWEFLRLPSMAPAEPARIFPLAMAPGETIAEGFEADPSLPLLPAPEGLPRGPADPVFPSLYEASLAYLTRTSGVSAGAGEDGSRGLVLRGLPLSGTAYEVPLAVGSGDRYEVEFRMRSTLGRDGHAGVRILEFAGSDLEVPSRVHVPVKVTGAVEWSSHGFSLAVPPDVRLVRLSFFRSGGAGDNQVAFDRIAISRAQAGDRAARRLP
jgi:spermidine synthase